MDIKDEETLLLAISVADSVLKDCAQTDNWSYYWDEGKGGRALELLHQAATLLDDNVPHSTPIRSGFIRKTPRGTLERGQSRQTRAMEILLELYRFPGQLESVLDSDNRTDAETLACFNHVIRALEQKSSEATSE